MASGARVPFGGRERKSCSESDLRWDGRPPGVGGWLAGSGEAIDVLSAMASNYLSRSRLARRRYVCVVW